MKAAREQEAGEVPIVLIQKSSISLNVYNDGL